MEWNESDYQFITEEQIIGFSEYLEIIFFELDRETELRKIYLVVQRSTFDGTDSVHLNSLCQHLLSTPHLSSLQSQIGATRRVYCYGGFLP